MDVITEGHRPRDESEKEKDGREVDIEEDRRNPEVETT